jgi:hypothetical protein
MYAHRDEQLATQTVDLCVSYYATRLSGKEGLESGGVDSRFSTGFPQTCSCSTAHYALLMPVGIDVTGHHSQLVRGSDIVEGREQDGLRVKRA